MFNLILLSVFVTRAFCDSKIVGGEEAKENEFPFAVSLRHNNSHTCGATILNEKFILTAAHCVCRDSKPLNADLYSIQYDLVRITKEPVNTVKVKEIYCNKFDSKKIIYDSAVLELDSAIPPGNWKPVTLAKNFTTNAPQKGVIIGWGRIFHNGPISAVLKKLNVDIYDDNTCKKEYDTVHHICFGAFMGGACNGDSGTALLVNGEQVGIASFITSFCGIANESSPNVYSRVATYNDWIASIAKLHT